MSAPESPPVSGPETQWVPSSPTTWREILTPIVEGRELTPGLARWALAEILSGAATPAQIGAFATGLAAKGVTGSELSALAAAMLDASTRVVVPGRTLDIVGTGGDGAGTVNISTMAALVAAAAGATVVKHGSRSASSKAGAGDVVEAAGAVLELSAARVAEIAAEVGFTFCLAAAFHPAMRHVAGPRRELGIRTVFNFLGPLANPADPSAIMLGCADVDLAPLMAGVLAERKTDALVVHGDDGLDELTTTGRSRIWLVRDGEVRADTFDPAAVGIRPAAPEQLRGGTGGENAAVLRRVLAGETGAVRDIVLLNAAAGLAVHAQTDAVGPDGIDLTELVSASMSRAAQAIDSGAAERLFADWIAATRRPS